MIVTRFAPSPTGYLHVGGARTALFCWLTARRHKGRMILRIEDTDQKRNSPAATQQVIDDLRWLGIDWDEGPDIGGPHGPYLQSQRREIYDRYVKKLLEEGKAYYCFDTTEELQAMREQAVTRKQTFIYPRPKEFPDTEAVARARRAGRPVTVRFAVTCQQAIVVEDMVRGEVRFAPGELSDFIIQKSDGLPTYHFACVVDDELMEITHVIRGQEHLMNTPCHQLLQLALGFRTPIYAHMSVTVSESGGKLSKRERARTLREAIKTASDIDLGALASAGRLAQDELDRFLGGQITPDSRSITAMADHLGVHLPEINVVDFFENGYLPEAMVNFLALLGWNPGDNREIMPLDKLMASFDLHRLTKTNSLFDRKKLIAFNTEHMRMVGAEKLLQRFKNYLKANNSLVLQVDDATLTHLLRACQGARTLADVEHKSIFLFKEKVEFDPQAVQKVFKQERAAELLAEARDRLAALDCWDEQSLYAAIEYVCKKNEVGMGKVAQPIRVAITGSTISPPIEDSLILLGKDRTIKRIDSILKYLEQQ